MDILEKAIAFATKAHNGQKRKGTDIDYIVHPLEVLDIVQNLTDDVDVQCAAVLHDVAEDAGVTKNTLIREFNTRIAYLVADESENKREGQSAKETWKIRKEETIAHIKKASRETKIICLGDKLSNARAIVRDLNEIGMKLFERFNASAKDELWYYSELKDALKSELSDTDEWKELDALVYEFKQIISSDDSCCGVDSLMGFLDRKNIPGV